MIKGGKRYILTDTIGPLVRIIVHPANVQGHDGAPDLLASVCSSFPWLRHIFADGCYSGDKVKAAIVKLGNWTFENVKGSDAIRGLGLLAPPRRVIERALAWLNHNRRLAKDAETTVECSVTWL